MNRGWLFDDRGDHVRAIADFQRATELDPKDARAWW
ncbi:tetratricopeptide repeat protein, partial [bacterium]|nr:tetratricopeptide repeat protein [bacterium]